MTDREYVKCQSAVVKAWDVLQMTLCESYGYEGLHCRVALKRRGATSRIQQGPLWSSQGPSDFPRGPSGPSLWPLLARHERCVAYRLYSNVDACVVSSPTVN